MILRYLGQIASTSSSPVFSIGGRIQNCSASAIRSGVLRRCQIKIRHGHFRQAIWLWYDPFIQLWNTQWLKMTLETSPTYQVSELKHKSTIWKDKAIISLKCEVWTQVSAGKGFYKGISFENSIAIFVKIKGWYQRKDLSEYFHYSGVWPA